MIEVTINGVPLETDRRYRMMVLLQRSDRPSYIKFHCPRCNMPVAELVNKDIVAMTDAIDMDSREAVGVRCDGRAPEGGRCSWWFYFTLGAK